MKCELCFNELSQNRHIYILLVVYIYEREREGEREREKRKKICMRIVTGTKIFPTYLHLVSFRFVDTGFELPNLSLSLNLHRHFLVFAKGRYKTLYPYFLSRNFKRIKKRNLMTVENNNLADRQNALTIQSK